MVDGVDSVPRKVRTFARDVQKYIGVEPQIEQAGPLSWRVVLEGSRIRATADMHCVNGKTKWVGGTLEVDGEERPAAAVQELRILWDKFERPSTGRIAALESVPVLPEGAVMPAEVRQLHDALACGLRDAGRSAPSVGCDGSRWIVGADAPDDSGDGIRIIFTRARGGQWSLAGKRPIQMVAGGMDLSAEMGRDAAKAIATLTGKNPAGSAIPPVGPVDRSARKARDIGVEMRKGNTIRV